ncbi:tetratricopeptide repeat protein [Lysobacter sp. A3-1-A15]|uniref:tetratricopeptide repeat protein n=1 Tax=Novilysobacter viscosus TaxID=3098602 RepID=UPI002EDBA876
MSVRTVVLTACLLLAGAAHAQTLPRPAEFYFDADASATQRLAATDKTGDAAVQELLDRIGRNARDVAATAQLAHLAMAGGREDLGQELYRRALAQLDANDRNYRPVLWGYGWDLYRADDPAGALEQWTTLVASKGLSSTWMPHTLALALWSVGREEEAVQWYAAAVRSEPQQWRTTTGYPSLLADWTPAERERLAEVQAAWAANPPRYP